MRSRGLFVLFISLLLVLSVGCSKMTKDEIDAIVSKADPITENLLTALNEGDYSKFSKDFDKDMKEKLSEESFKQLTSMVRDKIGNYKSKKFWKIDKDSKYMVVLYNARFDKEEGNVVIRNVLIEENGTFKVAGFFLDSPNLRKK